MQDEYKNALQDDTDLDKKVFKLGELYDLAYEDLINSSVRKVAFALVQNTKIMEFPEGNCNVA